MDDVTRKALQGALVKLDEIREGDEWKMKAALTRQLQEFSTTQADLTAEDVFDMIHDAASSAIDRS